MGKTMKKSTIIWGDRHSVTLANFNDSHLKDIEATVRQQIGPRAAFARAAAAKAVQQAKSNPKMKHAYVKVGLIDGAVVLRCKEKKFFGDIEVDATLVTDYRAKATAYIQELFNEFEQEQERQRQELARLKTEQERQQRLKEVMGRKGKDGTSLRDRLLLAAQTAQKLGIGNYAQTKLKVQGLQAMDPQYHGEVLDRKQNRYGRYLPDLKKVWDKEVDGQLSFSDWLDAVEKNDTSVPGVTAARLVTNHEVAGKVVQPGGVAGGLMIYLDEEARKGYVATASKGTLTGPTVKNGHLIFVVGPDNKLYVGSKARAKAGERKAFNHSSFFSGGPVKSAGTLTVAGGKVTAINDQSGHYAPTRAMVLAAMRKLGGSDDAWLQSVQVTVGGKTTTGREYFDGAVQEESVGIWGKYSIGAVGRAQAEAYLKAAPDGSWLVREQDGSTVFSARNGGALTHAPVSQIGGAGLDRKKLLTKDKLPDVPLVPPTTTRRRSTKPLEQRETEGEQTATAPQTKTDKPPTRRRTTRLTEPIITKPVSGGRLHEQTETESEETAPKTTKTRRQPGEQTETEGEETAGLSPRNDQALRASPAWHGAISRAAAEGLLRGKPGSWLLRVGRDDHVAFSQNNEGTLNHVLVVDDEVYANLQRFMRRHQAGMVRP